MAIKKSVFGSETERKNFNSLNSKWSQQVCIDHNLPILRIIDTRDLSLSPDEEKYLRMASVDYTLRCENGEPILSIELDGIADGFNVGDRYITEIPGQDESSRRRRYMMELKLKSAQKSGYPFFVVSTAEFEPFTREFVWSIVDGVVGWELKNRRLNELAPNFSAKSVGMSADKFENLAEADRDELVYDWLAGAEVDCELELDPLAELEAVLSYEVGLVGYSPRHDTDPSSLAITDLGKRKAAFQRAERMTCECTVNTRTLGSATARAIVPNFDGIGILGMSLSQRLAKITALASLRSRLNSSLR